MISVQFEPRDIIGFELAMKGLDARVLLMDEWDPYLVQVIDIIKKYPAPVPDSKYVRTFTLLHSWSHAVVDALTGQILNDAQQPNTAIYAGWVQGHEQTALHAGHGWINAFEKAEDLLYILIERVGDKAELNWSQS